MNIQISTLRKFGLNAALAFAGLAAFATEARADWYNCRPIEVLEFSGRVHVRCSNVMTLGGNRIFFVAIKNTDDLKVQRWITLANSALLSGKIFKANIPASSSTNVSGCLAADCRTPTAFGIGE
jgi:hypothetical protein